MSKWGSQEWYFEVTQGLIPKYSVVHKFGAGSVGTTVGPIAQSGTYQTPTTAQALEFVSDNANDTSAGTGARELTIVGLDSNWVEVSQTLVTNGTTAVALTTNLIRLYRWFVSSSGTYATEATSTHAGTLTIQASGGGTVWSNIGVTPFPASQS